MRILESFKALLRLLSKILLQIKPGVISLTEIEGYDKPLIELIKYTTWDEEKDGPIPGIKLFKHLNIFLEREYCEY